ncbi:MAG: hypothetical protein N3B16_12455 [Candidatus Aminicenantes bacterium]|nr:hypothetical protein [Candidatus Aminicenantes bacterium]
MLSINANLIVVFVFVWITIFILKKIFFDPLQRVRAKREMILAEERTAYEKATKEVEELAEKIEFQLKQARQEALARRQALEAEALQARSELIGQMQAEYRRQIAQARQELTELTRQLKGELEAEIEAIASKIEEKLLN